VCLDQVDLPAEPLPGSRHAGPARWVFLGRVSPKKGLDLALEALLEVDVPVRFDIFGPIEDAEHWRRCEELISRAPADCIVTYRGSVPPERVRETFGRYDAFLFPTHGENFGHVIAESLSASCPVVCTDRTPWTAVLRAGGGTVIPGATAEDLAPVLRRLAALDPDQRSVARARAGEAYRSWASDVEDTNILTLTHRLLEDWES
jgi:glycosyltransferase involved in cell wall biosynthesis